MSDIDETRAAIEKAMRYVDDLCQGRRRWTMCIPAQADDPDLVIALALQHGLGMVARAEAAEANHRNDLDHLGRMVNEATKQRARAEAAEAEVARVRDLNDRCNAALVLALAGKEEP